MIENFLTRPDVKAMVDAWITKHSLEAAKKLADRKQYY